MTAMVLASSFLSASLLTLLVLTATFIAILTWGLLVIRRHERDRESVQMRGRSGAGPDAADGSHSAEAG